MTETTETRQDPGPPPVPTLKKDARFYLGLGCLILSLISPVFIPVVLALPLSATAKGTLSTLLVVGGPDLLGLIAVVLLGKQTFQYLIAQFKALFRIKRPIQLVGRRRYTIGLIMFWGTLLISAVELNYRPAREIYGDYFTHAAVFWNLVFLASLFVLGANFWDKLRSLFVYDAVAVFPREMADIPEGKPSAESTNSLSTPSG